MSKAKNFIKEGLTIIVLSVIIVLPIRIFVAQPFVVSGDSMENTFHNNNYLIVDELSYRFEAPKRGDVVIFKVPPKGLALENEPANKTVYYIKRVIGLPGETVQIDGDQVEIYNKQNPNGFILQEPYTYYDTSVGSSTATLFLGIHEKITLSSDEYFVMGDNRHNSADSRLWGTLPAENIKGRVFARLFPPSALSLFPGAYGNYATTTLQ